MMLDLPAALAVAVVEDDPQLRDRILLPGLIRFGFDARGYGSAGQLAAALAAGPTDLVVLDVGLPDANGFSIVRRLRELSPRIGVVMLTSRVDTDDRVRGLIEGADAYLTKPVELDLLAATLHSLARRLATASVVSADTGGERRWRLSADGWCLSAPSGAVAALTQSERRLCRRLFDQPGELVSREALIAALTDAVHDFDVHRIDSMVYRLRSKVRDRCGETLPLAAVHGRGFVLTPG